MSKSPFVVKDVSAWQVANFSDELRQRIAKAAREQSLTIAEWLHRYFQTHGIEGQNFALFEPAAPAVADDAARLQHLAQLVAMARAMTPEGKDSAAMRLARSLVRERLTELRQQPAPAPPRALAAPAQPEPPQGDE